MMSNSYDKATEYMQKSLNYSKYAQIWRDKADIAHYINIAMESFYFGMYDYCITEAKKNRRISDNWTKLGDSYAEKYLEGKVYKSEAEAAADFAEVAVRATNVDQKERGAAIIPVVLVDCSVRYVLGDVFTGVHGNVVAPLLSDLSGRTGSVSYVHTHPNCTGHVTDGSSGPDIAGGAITVGQICMQMLNFNFSNAGDTLVPYLPNVDNMYLVTGTDKGHLYICNETSSALTAISSVKITARQTWEYDCEAGGI